MDKLINGGLWTDTDGNKIHAHGGCILKFGQWYYWYGEDRRDDLYVSCYRSKDLMNWEFRNHVLTVKSASEKISNETDLMLARDPDKDYGPVHELNLNRTDLYNKVNIERPKVLYNDKTGKFVLWAHFENGVNYSCARAAIATCDTPDGDFIYHGSFNPQGNMSRDCTLFKDVDDVAYFISNARNNKDMVIYRLTSDYLSVECEVNRLFIGESREAPVLFRHNNRYYMMTSFCSGWTPNQCKYSSSDSLEGVWQALTECGNEITFDTQPAFSLTLPGKNGDVLYFGDRWSGGEYFSSSYVVLPIKIRNENKLELSYCNAFSIDETQGRYLPCED